MDKDEFVWSYRRRGECRAMVNNKYQPRPGSRKSPRRTVAPSEYATYIKSPEWRAQRARYWASSLAKCCYACGLPWLIFNQGMHLHHRAYHNLGNERLEDLLPLCESCHFEVHQSVKERRRLWKATRSVKRRHLVYGLYNVESLLPGERRKWTDPQFLAKMRRRYG